MFRCPNCGQLLHAPLKDGIGSCLRCRSVFESTKRNKLLSAAFQLIKENRGFDHFQFYCQLDDDDAWFVYNLISEQQYTIDEFRKVLKENKDVA